METTNSRLSTSKIHHFENLPEPRNAIEEEQEAFHSKLYDFNIPDNIDDFNQTNTRYDKNTSKINSILKIQINSKNEANLRSEDQDDIFIEANLHSEDQDDILIEANLHSEDQDEFEIPDDGF
ncbi:unnamed protein product [Rhizophagus irregularis]|nr:unnamed protein product [Rhizophagus irregularis]